MTALARLVRDPRQTLRRQRLRIDELAERGARAVASALRVAHARVVAAGERLHALSPLAVLERGYAIARRVPDGQVGANPLNADDGCHAIARSGQCTIPPL